MLDGFNKSFDPRLNVLIGGRGTGKSSLVELIRYCLGAASYTSSAQKASIEHALGVLGDGRVTITLYDGSERIEVSRTSLQSPPDIDGNYTPPFVFSQSEIETIGLQASSRLRLIDAFLNQEDLVKHNESTSADVQSLTAEIRGLLGEIDDIAENTADVVKLQSLLDSLMRERAGQSTAHREIDSFRRALEEIRPSIASAHVRFEAIARSADRLTQWVKAIDNLLDQKSLIEPWPSQVGTTDELTELRRREVVATHRLQTSLGELRAVAGELHTRKELAQSQRLGLENRAREIRLRMEERQKGTSALDKRIVELTQQISVLQSLVELKQTRETRITELNNRRSKLIGQLDRQRHLRTLKRQEIVRRLNKELGPSIRLTLQPFAQRREYVSALAGALRGSGLRYTELAERISEVFSPPEIASLAERRHSKAIAKFVEISEESALRLCDALRSNAGAQLFATVVEDDVSIAGTVGSRCGAGGADCASGSADAGSAPGAGGRDARGREERMISGRFRRAGDRDSQPKRDRARIRTEFSLLCAKRSSTLNAGFRHGRLHPLPCSPRDGQHRFGRRNSPLGRKNTRNAVTPANALLNYLYAVLASEVTVALTGAGLDPGLGIFYCFCKRQWYSQGGSVT